VFLLWLTVDGPGSPAQRERRRRILDATIELASQGGFDAVQMRAVAERADVALGTLYRYFPSKIHLLVSGLVRQLEESEVKGRGTPVPGHTAHARVMHVLGRHTRVLQSEPHLTEALTRAFMFADASVAGEIRQVESLLTTVLTRAMADPDDTVGADAEPPAEYAAVARVIGDVWLASLVGWVTGRTSADEVLRRMDQAVSLLLR
jgi:AcrR family transcriptional regulator